MASKVNAILSFFLLTIILLANTAESSSLVKDPANLCVYTVYIRTGSIWKGGTDSVIGLNINDTFDGTVVIPDLVSWGGLMGPDHDYYERGYLDIFSGLGPCLASAPCSIELYSNGAGAHHGWYCNYVEVTSTGPHMDCKQQKFTIEQWLARDAPPYQLTAVRDNCGDDANRGRDGESM